MFSEQEPAKFNINTVLAHIPEEMTEKQVADMLSVRAETLRHWRKQGCLTPEYKPWGRSARYFYNRLMIAKTALICGLRFPERYLDSSEGKFTLNDIRDFLCQPCWLENNRDLILKVIPPPEVES